MLWIRLLYKLTRKYFGFSPIYPHPFLSRKKRVRLQAGEGVQRPSCSQRPPQPPQEARPQVRLALGPAAGWGPFPEALPGCVPRTQYGGARGCEAWVPSFLQAGCPGLPRRGTGSPKARSLCLGFPIPFSRDWAL